MPNFSRINLHSNDINNKSSRFLTNIRKEITNEILNNKTNTKYKKAKELTNLQNALFDLEPVDWIKLQQLVEEKKVKITTQVEAVHQKKLIALGIRENFNVNSKNINMRRNNIDKSENIINTETIFNFSKRVLNPTETSVLNKGLKFPIH